MKVHEQHYDVIVVGGGASGMMAAGTAAKNGKSVLLLEKNGSLGEKLKITGGGRCNITNYQLDDHALLEQFGEAKSALFSPFSQFSVKDTFTFFEKKKLPLDIQARKRVFPKTQRAYDVFSVMKEYIKKEGVKIELRSPVIKINIQGESISSVDTKKERYTATSYIIATGGVSYPETGSTGDGFQWLKKLGHTVHQPTPDIVPLRSNDKWVQRISGTKLSFMKITFFCDYRKEFSETGKLLFTHFGLSSPLILNASRKVGKLLKKGYVHAEVDLFPDTDVGSLDKKVLKIFDKNKNKDLKNTLYEITEKKLAEVIFDMLRLGDPHAKVHSVSTEERKRLVGILKKIPITIDGLMGLDRAVLADGGVKLDEVDTRTMRSKKLDNLFLTGDMLHVNRPSGGYSLQLCWTTGYVAGMNA